MAKILLLEDDLSLKKTLSDVLKHHQHQLFVCSTIKRFEELLEDHCFDLLILDRQVKDGDAYSCLTYLNLKTKKTRCLIMSKTKTQEHRVMGFNLGGNDILLKPFSLEEFYLRVNNLLNLEKNIFCKTHKFGKLLYHPKLGIIQNGSTQNIFRPKERAVFDLLYRNRGQILTVEDIINYVWQHTLAPKKNTLEVYIRRIRSKLFNQGSNLETIRGIGYRLKF